MGSGHNWRRSGYGTQRVTLSDHALFAAAQLNHVGSGSRTNTDTCPLSPKLAGPCVIATSFALNLDSAFDADYIDSTADFFSRIRSLSSYPWLEQVSS